MAESRFSKASLNPVTQLAQGYLLPVDNPGADAMETLDPQYLLSNIIKRVDIGEWNLFTTPVKTVSLAAYAGRVKGIMHVEIVNDDNESFDGSALWDSWVFGGQNDVATLNGAMSSALGSGIEPIAHGFIHQNGEPGSCAIYSSSYGAQSFEVAKEGQQFTVTFNPAIGVTATNAIVVINVTDTPNQELESSYMINNGFVVDFTSAVSFYYMVYFTPTGFPSANTHGLHTHALSDVKVRANTNLFNFNIIRKINAANNSVDLTHNYHGQVATGEGAFGATTKELNTNSLAKFRSRTGGATRGYLWLLLEYPSNPY